MKLFSTANFKGRTNTKVQIVLAQEKLGLPQESTNITNEEVKKKKHLNAYASIGFYVLSSDEGNDNVKKVLYFHQFILCLTL
jgi:hypothetical protein